MSYEKEVKANGLTEHRHYIGAGGDVVAQIITRTGTLNGQPAASVQYLHKDNLGSVVAVTDAATGAVVERLAYDPWGKRQNTNGQPDRLDALVGKSGSRGFTMA